MRFIVALRSLQFVRPLQEVQLPPSTPCMLRWIATPYCARSWFAREGGFPKLGLPFGGDYNKDHIMGLYQGPRTYLRKLPEILTSMLLKWVLARLCIFLSSAGEGQRRALGA